MSPTSLSAYRPITPQVTCAPPADPGNPANRTKLRTLLQDCARRKDWRALHDILAACPDTFKTERHGEPHPVLELDLADARELGDLAEHLPPDAQLPVFVVRGADLLAPDQRIAQLTAHRHSLGLKLENCTVDFGVMLVLTQGATRGQAAGYPGLRVLGCTHTQAMSVCRLFAAGLTADEYEAHEDQCGMLDTGIDQLIGASPHLEVFSMTGLVPSDLMCWANDAELSHVIIDLQPVFAALARTPLRQLHLDNCSSYNFGADTDAMDGWQSWHNSSTVSIQRLELTRWCLQARGMTPTEAGVLLFLGAAGISGSDRGPVSVECAGMADAPRAAAALGRALRHRHADTTIRWSLTGAFIRSDHLDEADCSWEAFCMALVPAPAPSNSGFREPLSLTLRHAHPLDLEPLLERLDDMIHLRSLKFENNERIERDDPSDTDVCCRRLRAVDRLLDTLKRQKNLMALDLDYSFKPPGPYQNCEQSEAHRARIAQRDAARCHQQSRQYQVLVNQIATDNRRDRIAGKMATLGLDLGQGGRIISDVSTVIARHIDGDRGHLGQSLWSMAQTNQLNHETWSMASRQIGES